MPSFVESETTEEPRLFSPHLWVKEWCQRRAPLPALGLLLVQLWGGNKGLPERCCLSLRMYGAGVLCEHVLVFWHTIPGTGMPCCPVNQWDGPCVVCWLAPGYVLFCSRCLDEKGGHASASGATLSLILGSRDISSVEEGRLKVENWGVFFSFMSRGTIYCQIQSENCRWYKYIAYFCSTVFVYLLWLKFNFYL